MWAGPSSVLSLGVIGAELLPSGYRTDRTAWFPPMFDCVQRTTMKSLCVIRD